MSAETVATGRAKRATAGNRMQELLEKAHQQDDEDLFKEEEGDEEFTAPVDQRDVFLEDFADTDDEVEMDDEEAEERAIRREERRKAKGKAKAIYNPLGPSGSKPKKVKFPPEPSGASSSTGHGTASGRRAEDMELLDPNVDPTTMAKSTLVLALRKQRREQKRLHRDQNLRSTLRASTLRTEEEILEREKAEKQNPNRKGRLAQHVTGEIRVVRKMTQDELIAAALEEEERNRESLKDWLRKEEERRELRRVGRKRVRGPRWTWVSRTVGKMVEEVEADPAKDAARISGATPVAATPGPEEQPSLPQPSLPPPSSPQPSLPQPSSPQPSLPQTSLPPPREDTGNGGDVNSSAPDAGQKVEERRVNDSSTLPPGDAETPRPSEAPTPAPVVGAPTNSPPPTIAPSPAPLQPDHDAQAEGPKPAEPSQPDPSSNEAPSRYTRNYIILSQIPGGLAKELQLVLGDHVEWDQVKYIPHRNRPINRRPVVCPFTGLQAKYRHPQTLVPYANIEGYRQIEALLNHRYLWDADASVWFGGEQDVGAEGVEAVQGWREAMHGGWIGGRDAISSMPEEQPAGEVEVADGQVSKKGSKRRSLPESDCINVAPDAKRGKTKRGSRKGRG